MLPCVMSMRARTITVDMLQVHVEMTSRIPSDFHLQSNITGLSTS